VQTLAVEIDPVEASAAVTKTELWPDSRFDVLIIATSGRFTTDAVAWIEEYDRTHRLSVEMWPDIQLETLLATRPHLVEGFGLRPGRAQ
jgi:hypothetical protein